MDEWVGQVDDPYLNRSWEICKECVTAHAIVDRKEGQTARQAHAVAWLDLVDGFRGANITQAYRGLIGELFDSVPEDRESELEMTITNAHIEAGGDPEPVCTCSAAGDGGPQTLRLVWDAGDLGCEH